MNIFLIVSKRLMNSKELVEVIDILFKFFLHQFLQHNDKDMHDQLCDFFLNSPYKRKEKKNQTLIFLNS